jgi:L-lactate utilization protein LutB
VNVLLIEPSSIQKRRRYSDSLIHKKSARPLSLEDIKKRLKEIRCDSIDHLPEYHKQLTERLKKHSDIKVSYADTDKEVSDIVMRESGNNPIAVNKSAVIANAVVPELIRANKEVIETYYDELKPFENVFDEGMHLPTLTPELVFNSFNVSGHMDIARNLSVKKQGSKNFTGVIGLNAISVEDGTIVLLQHMGNIQKIFKEARKMIIVVGLDKIVKNREDAIFQTKCMGVFGWEALPRPESMYYKSSNGKSLENLLYEISPENTEREIHVIFIVLVLVN